MMPVVRDNDPDFGPKKSQGHIFRRSTLALFLFFMGFHRRNNADFEKIERLYLLANRWYEIIFSTKKKPEKIQDVGKDERGRGSNSRSNLENTFGQLPF